MAPLKVAIEPPESRAAQKFVAGQAMSDVFSIERSAGGARARHVDPSKRRLVPPSSTAMHMVVFAHDTTALRAVPLARSRGADQLDPFQRDQ